MLTVGQLIWVSSVPLIRLAICVGAGFAIAKADIFPLVAARGAGQIILNIALPCLMFSKIIPAFTSENIGALGPLILIAVLYGIFGITIAWIIKQFFWVPHRFRYGILIAGGWGNYGDIPTSVVMSITASFPFKGTEDQTLAIAYNSVFLLVFFITMFPLGAHCWVAKDYNGPGVEDEEVRQSIHAKRQKLLTAWRHIPLKIRRGREPCRDVEINPPSEDEKHHHDAKNRSPTHAEPASGKRVSFIPPDETRTVVATEDPISRVCSPTSTEVVLPGEISATTTMTSRDPPGHPKSDTSNTLPTVTVSNSTPRRHFIIHHLRTFLRSLFTPTSISIFIAFPVALIQPLKALFVTVPVPGIHIQPAPDGHPPLALIIDTASFIGAASIPLGLICLGSALARLEVPRAQWGRLPLGAIAWLAIGKMVVMPVIGVLLSEGLVKVGVIDKDDKVLQFVCIFFSCLPTATTQVLLTQVYSGTGSAEHLSAFIIPQYILMFISMTALTAYSLQMLF